MTGKRHRGDRDKGCDAYVMGGHFFDGRRSQANISDAAFTGEILTMMWDTRRILEFLGQIYGYQAHFRALIAFRLVWSGWNIGLGYINRKEVEKSELYWKSLLVY
jgi:hypothetical protein